MVNPEYQIPLPSHIHYELLLQLLERQTMAAAYQNPVLKTKVQELIGTLRKALSQQRQIEDICQQSKISLEYYWSLNDFSKPSSAQEK
ncbi:DUF5340 domain-containing protein [Pseudanabaena sp. FACHB-2040]|uniref:DUF5340 domain-containing protein n=1 Tax=Pseudanabaena sp. FACHB-2040 TaxID=2692859 RepID=UPI001686C102|nr:DUF5340 domain-containing protein [Pseudanabaena sp. FACHB-2040]MBD0268513.1 DUF5340 domain-containing protein [Cyanobacteria bacterium Co-bin8]MBD2258838.1 DUF5340 domain-containing protein [Pseudanabaena sp. FACHB-2040]